jgi:Asp-tRNA(Asn)/Glu-tRNA(Gln) amidotransferase A subunit family amidase
MVDLEIAYRFMAQPDALNDKSALFAPPGSSTINDPKRRKVLGIYKPWFDRADPEVKSSCEKTIEYLTTKLGYEMVDITIPLIPEGQSAHALTILSELCSGVAASAIWKVESSLPSTRTPFTSILTPLSQLQPATKVLFSVGRQTTAIDFLQAQRVRQILMQHLSHLFATHPSLIILTPTTPNAGWPIGPNDLAHGASNGNMSIRNMQYVWLANFSGCPSLTAPVGFVEPKRGKGKVPIGLMGMAEWCAEDELIAFGYDCEKYVKEGLEGGRVKPGNWMDVLEMAKKGEQ